MRRVNYIDKYPLIPVAVIIMVAIVVFHYCFPPEPVNNDEKTIEVVAENVVARTEKAILLNAYVIDRETSEKLWIRRIDDAGSIKAGDGLTIYKGFFERTVIDLRHVSAFERTKIWMLKQREHLLDRLHSTNINDEEFAIVAAMALGEKSGLSQEIRHTFSGIGVSHLLALSGLHMGIIATFLLLFMRPFMRRNPLLYTAYSMLIILPLWVYVFVTGMPISAIRSALMISVCIIVAASGRKKVSLNTLALAAIIILIIWPESLFEISFQLSFLSLLGIFIIYPMLSLNAFRENDSTIYKKKNLSKRMKSLGIRIWNACAISLSAQLMTTPLILYYFGNVSPYFIITNLIAIPLTTIILYLVCLWFLTITTVSFEIPLLITIISYSVDMLTAFLRFVSTWPYAVVENLHITMLQTVILYVFLAELLLWWHNNNAKRSELLLFTILTFVITTYFGL